MGCDQQGNRAGSTGRPAHESVGLRGSASVRLEPIARSYTSVTSGRTRPLLACSFCHNPTLQHYRLPNVTTNWLLRASATYRRWVLQEPQRGFSCLVFDLLPALASTHLVPVILKHPRREESGRRKSLNPGPIGQPYTGPRIRTSENASSRH